MPAKITMHISNGNEFSQYQKQMIAKQKAEVQKFNSSRPSLLSAPMISRIHNVRPGCGSCGGVMH